MKKKKTLAEKLSPQRIAEQRATQIVDCKTELDSIRKDMRDNVGTWDYIKMKSALERASQLNKQLKKIVS